MNYLEKQHTREFPETSSPAYFSSIYRKLHHTHLHISSYADQSASSTSLISSSFRYAQSPGRSSDDPPPPPPPRPPPPPAPDGETSRMPMNSMRCNLITACPSASIILRICRFLPSTSVMRQASDPVLVTSHGRVLATRVFSASLRPFRCATVLITIPSYFIYLFVRSPRPHTSGRFSPIVCF